MIQKLTLNWSKLINLLNNTILKVKIFNSLLKYIIVMMINGYKIKV